jgi:hypothetical protein
VPISEPPVNKVRRAASQGKGWLLLYPYYVQDPPGWGSECNPPCLRQQPRDEMYALSGIGNSKVGDNTARVLVRSPAPLVAIRTYVGNGLRRWLYDACVRLFLVGLEVSRRNCNCSVP